jgi:hypothetical protein
MSEELVCDYCGETGNDKGPWKNKRALNMHERHCKGKQAETDVQEFADSVERSEPIVRRSRRRTEILEDDIGPFTNRGMFEEIMDEYDITGKRRGRFLANIKKMPMSSDWDYKFKFLENALSRSGMSPEQMGWIIGGYRDRMNVEAPPRMLGDYELLPLRQSGRRASRYGGRYDGRYDDDRSARSQGRDLGRLEQENENLREKLQNAPTVRDLMDMQMKMIEENRRHDIEVRRMDKESHEKELTHLREMMKMQYENNQRSIKEKFDDEVIATARGFRGTMGEVKDYILTGAQRLEESRQEAPPSTVTSEYLRENARLYQEAFDELGHPEYFASEFRPRTPAERRGMSMERRQNQHD